MTHFRNIPNPLLTQLTTRPSTFPNQIKVPMPPTRYFPSSPYPNKEHHPFDSFAPGHGALSPILPPQNHGVSSHISSTPIHGVSSPMYPSPYHRASSPLLPAFSFKALSPSFVDGNSSSFVYPRSPANSHYEATPYPNPPASTNPFHGVSTPSYRPVSPTTASRSTRTENTTELFENHPMLPRIGYDPFLHGIANVPIIGPTGNRTMFDEIRKLREMVDQMSQQSAARDAATQALVRQM
jgi:hypothetical protein